MEDARTGPQDAGLARSALVAACAGWALLLVAALIAALRSGPVPDRYAADGVSTVIGLVGLAGVLLLIAGIARGALALARIRSGRAQGRTQARWAVLLGSVPFVLVLIFGVVTLLTLH